jgi:O6-methylguanine-DNA--protein-cysteine methyltransferase
MKYTERTTEFTAPEAYMTTFDTTLRWTLALTEIGPCMVITGPAGIRQILIGEGNTEQAASDTNAIRDDDGLRAMAEALAGLVDGSRTEFPFPVDLMQGTAFQRTI